MRNGKIESGKRFNEKKTGKSGAGPAGRKKQVIEEVVIEDANPLARIILGILLIFLGLFLLLGLFGIEALVPGLLKTFFLGAFGYGAWLTPFALFFAAWVLIFRGKEPTMLRLTMLFLLVLFFSAMIHTILCRTDFSGKLISGLWTSGKSGSSGGLVPGMLACLLIYLFSRQGTVPLLLLLCLVSGMFAFKINIKAILHAAALKKAKKQGDAEKEETRPISREELKEDLEIISKPFRRKAGRAETEPDEMPPEDEELEADIPEIDLSAEYDDGPTDAADVYPEEEAIDPLPPLAEKPPEASVRKKSGKKGDKPTMAEIAAGRKAPKQPEAEDDYTRTIQAMVRAAAGDEAADEAEDDGNEA